MNENLLQLYQQLIIDHGRNPRNFGKLECCTHSQEGYNPICGDQLELFLEIDKDIIKNVKFSGHGCAISMASASLMTSAIKGHDQAYAQSIFYQFTELLKEDCQANIEDLGKLKVLEGVKHYPSRIKCATLSWHALNNILNNIKEVAKTE